jgi:alpha-tubulin suppressor-like RCC1 family protein
MVTTKKGRGKMTKLSAWKYFSLIMALVLVISLGAVTMPARPVRATGTPMVSAGVFHTLGLKSDGTVIAVGCNDQGQCEVNSWTGITQVSAGLYQSVGLKSDGTVVAVGLNSDGQLGVGLWTDITQVSAGGLHTVGLKSDGTVVATGSNDDGQCDVGTWTGITQVAAGYYHTVGLKSDGSVVAAGNNEYYQCNVTGWTDITQVAAGGYHTVGLKSDGTVVAIGNNYSGECDVDSWTDISQIAAGRAHTVGLKSDGTVVAVGWNLNGQLYVDSWADITQVSAGGQHTVGLKSDGTVVAVGDNEIGQCQNINSWINITQVSAGYSHTVGLKSDHTVIAVGNNDASQCNINGWTNINQVSAGGYHTAGLRSDGSVWTAGSDSYGQCDTTDWTDITQVSAGLYHTVGLKSDGTVIAIGWNNYGQCNIDDWTGITQVSAGGWHTVGLKSDGTVVAVGAIDNGRCNTDNWTDITQVAAGGGHTVGLESDGTAVAVGYNNRDQCDVDSWTGITQVSAGYYHTVGLLSDGTVVATGSNDDGQCDVGTWTGITQVAAGGYHTVGLGSVVAVGKNDNGQCNLTGWNLVVAISAPIAATNAASNVQQTTATLNGSVTDDGGEGCQYRFEYDTDSGEPYASHTEWTGSKTTGQSFSENIDSLSQVTKYYFRAQCKNSAGTSSGSELSFNTRPGVPTSFSATAVSSSQIDLSWTKGDSAQKTMVRRSDIAYPTAPDAGNQVYFDTGTSISDTSGLSPGTTYYYSAWSWVVGSDIWSSTYAQATATTLALPLPPPKPTLKSPAGGATVSTLTPTLEWNAADRADSYGVQVATTSAFTTKLVDISNITELHYDITSGLNWAKTYYWRVNAHNDGGTSSWSAYRSFKTSVGPPPDFAPSNLVATAITSTRIQLDWQDNSSNETSFKIERKTGAGGTYAVVGTVTASVTTFTNGSRVPNTTYFYRVRAHNAGGNSGYSNEVSAMTFPAPTKKSPAGGATVSTLTPKLEWNALIGATSYGVQVATTSTFTTKLVDTDNITGLYYDITGGLLNWSKTYYWRVRAHKGGDTSSWSAYRTFKTSVGPPPDAPSNLTATATTSTRIQLDWQDNSSNETSFKIERKTGAGGTYAVVGTVVTDVTTFTNGDRVPNTTYFYRVRAHNAGGNSGYSNEVSAMTLRAPTLSSPAGGATVPSLTPTLAWNVVTNANTYSVQVATTSTFTTLLVDVSSITELHYDVTGGLNPNTTYYWHVSAQNSGGTSSWSAYRSFKTPAGP